MDKALKSRNEMLLKTIELLEDVIKKVGGDDTPIEFKSAFRTMVLLRSANLFDEMEMIMDIKGRMLNLIKYSDKTYLFDFKVGELVHDLRYLINNKQKELFNYN
jgi:hypothetical protein